MNTLQQELPERFTRAVTKLYNAFHENKLDAMRCSACAVGNICDNNGDWVELRHYVGENKSNPSKYSIRVISGSGYNRFEIVAIEQLFLRAMGLEDYNNVPNDIELALNKDSQFKGLCSVIEYLCELDNIQNIMDYTSLFEFNEDKEPVNQLTF